MNVPHVHRHTQFGDIFCKNYPILLSKHSYKTINVIFFSIQRTKKRFCEMNGKQCILLLCHQKNSVTRTLCRGHICSSTLRLKKNVGNKKLIKMDFF